ncbi:hypothetical protein KOI35_08685 [Actinoplanes bogorensis]|uniref:Aminoglycoside phosphotransferase domain-containing protein n=1 Tax=Paractinoplanes bogorensis TaxID=1610840 RepID=A0ABS5YJE4_9ACTN|nr:phosphotransferase [Actinoplanes bogorensis]MBU2663580.1 hypothetical protein [Actinoplanes bogorensis]
MVIGRVVERFGLGRLSGKPVAVSGGLSNELWRVRTENGEFAVKRMIVNAREPRFVANVEAAFLIEQRAWNAGVPMPEPIAEPGSGRALIRAEGDSEHDSAGDSEDVVKGGLFRVHRWVDGRAGAGDPDQAAELLATIHAAGRPRWEATRADVTRADVTRADITRADVTGADVQAPLTKAHLDGDGPITLHLVHTTRADATRQDEATPRDPDLVDLVRRVSRGPDRMLVVDSHQDLDRKNTLLRSDGTLLALDWDAAGPIGAVPEAVGLALDWADGDRDAFVRAVTAYRRRSRIRVEAQPWIFGAWVDAAVGWLDYNTLHRAGEDLGRAEIAATTTRLNALARDLDSWLDALAGSA